MRYTVEDLRYRPLEARSCWNNELLHFCFFLPYTPFYLVAL